jgi:hypothetical protein
MSRSYTSSPPKRLHGVKRDCFTFTFYPSAFNNHHNQSPPSKIQERQDNECRDDSSGTLRRPDNGVITSEMSVFYETTRRNIPVASQPLSPPR